MSQLLGEAKRTFDLDQLMRHFTQLCQNKDHPYNIINFYEKRKTSLPRKLCPWLPQILAQEKLVRLGTTRHCRSCLFPMLVINIYQLVDESFAILDIVPYPIPLSRSHVTMNKFRSPEDEGYKIVAGEIRDILRKIRTNSPLEEVDAWIRNECYTPKRLEIERLTGDSLLMDQCYTNLTIVEQQLDGKSSWPQEDKPAQRSSQFSLFARLKIDEPDEKIQVVLSKLFDERQAHDGQMRRPKRVLIRGWAGVGKTTLCKKIIHDFIGGKL